MISLSTHLISFAWQEWKSNVQFIQLIYASAEGFNHRNDDLDHEQQGSLAKIISIAKLTLPILIKLQNMMMSET